MNKTTTLFFRKVEDDIPQNSALKCLRNEK